MPDAPTIRPYHATDERRFIELWNSSVWADPLDAATWRSRYLLDPNFDASECLVAELNGELTGFVFGISTKSEPGRVITPPTAWVVAFGVAPGHRRLGIARALFSTLADTWRPSGIKSVSIGPYVPSYLTPGVDEAAYPDAIAFLRALGTTTASRPLSMKASLTAWKINPDVAGIAATLANEGISIRPVEPADILPLLQFLEAHFDHWRGDASGVLGDLFGSDPRFVTMHVAVENGSIIGYAQSRAERFGPFGVNEAYRGRGIGAALLASALGAMRSRGFHCAWFLWTSDRAAKLYREHGFEEVRRFALMTWNLH